MFIKIIVSLVALQHFGIMAMEMFLWEKRGPAIFKSFPTDLFAKTTAMAKNMGLYNGFIAAGLAVSLVASSPVFTIYFLVCVVVAGAYASLPAERSIFLKQSSLALVALLLIGAEWLLR